MRLRKFLASRLASVSLRRPEPSYPRRDPLGTLAELFLSEGTDKGCYAEGYEILLAPRREHIARVLEIGIGTLVPEAPSSMQGWGAAHYRPGGSLRAWRAYFPHAAVVGIDIQPDTQFQADRITTAICDSTDAAAATRFLENQQPFDLIIDDGSHLADDQLATLGNFLPALAPAGLYIIEDIDQNSPLYDHPEIVEPLIGPCAYMTMDYSNLRPDPGKNIVIRAPANP